MTIRLRNLGGLYSTVEWQSDREAGSFPQLTRNFYVALHLLDGVAHNRETEAGSAHLPRACLIHPVKALEYSRLVLPGNSNASIAH
jgi:hypothetical protein